MDFKAVQPDLVKYEMRMVEGVDPHVKEQGKPGFFGRLLSGMGRVLGSVAMPLSFIFPPAAIGAAGMYGVGQIGDLMQYKTAQRQMQQLQNESQRNVAFPGLQIDESALQPAGYDLSVRDEQVMNVLFARSDSMSQMAHML